MSRWDLIVLWINKSLRYGLSCRCFNFSKLTRRRSLSLCKLLTCECALNWPDLVSDSSVGEVSTAHLSTLSPSDCAHFFYFIYFFIILCFFSLPIKWFIWSCLMYWFDVWLPWGKKNTKHIHAHVQVVHCENTQNRLFFFVCRNTQTELQTVVLASLDGIKPEVERAHQNM